MENSRTQQQDEPIKNNDQPLEGQHGSSSGTQQTTSNSSSGQQADSGERRHTSAAGLDALISSPTANVHARHHQGLHGHHIADTGTNISYEGATAPGGGGSAGTGEASGQSATGSSITSTSADQAVSGANNPHSQQQSVDDEASHTGADNPLQKQHDDDLDRDTVGTP